MMALPQRPMFIHFAIFALFRTLPRPSALPPFSPPSLAAAKAFAVPAR
jgi:hypothetical protein